MAESTIPCKVYLLENDDENSKVRRLGLDATTAKNFHILVEKISRLFSPELDETSFVVYWIDKDGDNILVSSNEELTIAISEMLEDIKKARFFIKVETSETINKKNDCEMSHPFVSCDGCDKEVVGFRYKCIVCDNYDLCSDCEKKCIHPDHVILRIPNPFVFDQGDLQKLVYLFSSFLSCKGVGSRHHSHHRKKHSHDFGSKDFNKKKRKCDKYEYFGKPDETEDLPKFCKKKRNNCTFTQLINDLLEFGTPGFKTDDTSKPETGKTFKKESEETGTGNTQPSSQELYLKAVGRKLISLLDPLGIDVDFEVRTKGDEKKESKTDEKTGETPAPTPTPTPTPTPSTSSQKVAPEEQKETMAQKIDEISKILANQKVSESPDKDDWVSFEELKGVTNEKESTTPKAPKNEQPKETPGASAPPKENVNLYPELNTTPTSPHVKAALEKMLSMGFTNDGGWLTHLLEAKNGDINLALEVLAPHKTT